MKLPGRTPILVDLDASEYGALNRLADKDKVSMTVLVRNLVREHLMKDELLSARLSKRVLRFASDKQPLMVHFADEEHDFLLSYADRAGKSVTTVLRNLIRKHIMGVGELADGE